MDKHNENIVIIRDEVKAQTERTERQSDSVNSVEVQLKESAKREKLTQCKLIHMDAKERTNNLMCFGVPKDDKTTTCEETLQLHINKLTSSIKVETPSHIFNTKRVGSLSISVSVAQIGKLALKPFTIWLGQKKIIFFSVIPPNIYFGT